MFILYAHLQGLHEGFGPRLGDGSQVVDQIGLGHTDSRVLDGEGLGLFVLDDFDAQVLSGVQFRRVGQGLVADLVQGIGGVGDQLTEENLFVGVECVDDEAHELCDLGLEGKGLALALLHCFEFWHWGHLESKLLKSVKISI